MLECEGTECTCGCTVEWQVERFYEDVFRFNPSVIARCKSHSALNVEYIDVFGPDDVVVTWENGTQSKTWED